MIIRFDNTAKIAGIGLVPWTRLGPERFFSNYKIASLYGWDLQGVEGVPEVLALSDMSYGMPVMEKLRTQRLVESPEFQQMVKDRFQGYDFLTYKPVDLPEGLRGLGCRLLSMNQALTATLENKAEFRLKFADLGLPFPAYDILERESLVADDKSLELILAGRESVILQDEMLSGGRGTYRVHDVASLERALTCIARLGGGQRVVVSEMVNGANERTVQAVATKYGVFVGPLQKQIVANPVLANLEVPDGDRFCGGEISPSDPLRSKYAEIRGYAMKIGARLQELGYKGIFGLDCLIDADGKVYVLEINPRLTGMTPLLTMLYREGLDIPFYLLHMLELAGIDYEITDDTVAEEPPEGALMVMHSHEPYRNRIVESPKSGLYRISDLEYLGQHFRLPSGGSEDTMLLQQYTPPGFRGRPGGRLMAIFVGGRVLDDHDKLLPEIAEAVKNIESQVILEEVPADE